MPVFEMGVWAKTWRGKKEVRGGEEARLHNVAPRRGDTVESWSYGRGWVEEWVIQRGVTQEVLRYTRVSPSRDGWRLSTLGIREVDNGSGSCKEVAEVWTKGEINRETGLAISTICPERFQWYL